MTEIMGIESLDLLVGLLIVCAIFLRDGLARIGIPPIVSYILLGFALRALDNQVDLVSEHGLFIIEFLAGVGVFFILFRVGVTRICTASKKCSQKRCPFGPGTHFCQGFQLRL